MSDTLGSTFAKYFGPTEETGGTGAVIRVVNSELREVVIDEEERAAWLAKVRAEREAHNREVEAIHELMERLNE